MLKKMAVVGGIVAVAGLGLGGAAWAESNSAPATPAVPGAAPLTASTSTVAPTTASSPGKATKAGKAAKSKHARREGLAKRLEQVSHAQWVAKDGKTGVFVTHDAVRGTVSAVSAGSITVKATDGTSETFTVTSATKVHVRGTKATNKTATKAAATISQVKVGDRAGVLGTGAGPMTATQVIDRGVPKPAKPTAAPTTS